MKTGRNGCREVNRRTGRRIKASEGEGEDVEEERRHEGAT